MSNLIDIQGQIEKLLKQANEIKSKEFSRTVQEIVATMQAFGITPKDLSSARSKTGKSKAATAPKGARNKAKKAGAVTVAAKYRGPNGEIWTGRGLTPRWLSTQVGQGRKKEEFAIK